MEQKKILLYETFKVDKISKRIRLCGSKKIKEIDKYFTDIDSEYIKNRTCLRIRQFDNEEMEITFKGKSLTVGQFCKLENNIFCNISEYDNLINLLSSLGYYSYVIVEKDRMVYEYRSDKYIYSFMIDTLSKIGGFVEFEIISEREESSKVELKNELDIFVSKFDKLNLDEAVKSYRGIVADYIIILLRIMKLINNKEKTIYISDKRLKEVRIKSRLLGKSILTEFFR